MAVDWNKPYERSDVEYEPIEVRSDWGTPPCKHCGLSVAHHWLTADCRLWCVRNVL